MPFSVDLISSVIECLRYLEPYVIEWSPYVKKAVLVYDLPRYSTMYNMLLC